jgi:hypothetical protein
MDTVPIFRKSMIHMQHFLIQVVRLASHAGGAMAQAAAAGDAGAALPAETLRCAGPASCAGVREGVLWLLDSRGQPFVLPISHAGLRARSLALAGAPAAARSIAEQGACVTSTPL